MSARSDWHTDLGKAAAVACIAACSFAAAWGLSFAFPAAFMELDGHAADLLHAVRYHLQGPGKVSPRIMHVVVTDRSRDELKLAGWDRRAFGRALEILHRLGARTIVCDVFFRDASFADNDALLVESARKSGNVVFPVFLVPRGPSPDAAADAVSGGDEELLERCALPARVEQEGTPPAADYLVPPFAALAEAAGTFGHINLLPDADGVSRRVPLLYRCRGVLIPSLALAASLQFLQVNPRAVQVSFGRHILLRGARFPGGPPTDITIPIDRDGSLIVDPAGPWENAGATVSMAEVLAAGSDPAARSRLRDLVEDTLLVVSDVSTMNRDHGPGIFERVYPLSGLHVSVVNSILTRRFLSRQGAPSAAVICAVLAALLCAAALRLKGLAFPAFCAALYVLWLGMSYGSFAGLGIVPGMAVPTTGFVFAAAALIVYRIVLSERARSAAEVTLESNRTLETLNADLTGQRRALEEANARLRDMERTREKAAQDVARELRAPILGLLQSVEAVRAGAAAGGASTLAEGLDTMRREAGRLIGLVNQLVGNGGAETPGGPAHRPAQEDAGRAEPPRGRYNGNEDPVLLIGARAEALGGCAAALEKEGIPSVSERRDAEGVLPCLRRRSFCAAVLDYEPGRIAAAGLVPAIRDEFPSLQVVVLSDPADISSAVECIRQGASDYLVKPVEPGLMVSAVRLCMERRNIEKQVSDLSRRLHTLALKRPEAFSRIVTISPRMLALFRYVEAIAADANPVLITGESGVGKELMAEVIHRLSGRQGACVRENVAGLDDAMITDTLFGHARGAFTDAKEARRGLVEEAGGGTLFLDEIGDLPINSQVKLLRLLEGGEYRQLGLDTARTSNARVVVATNVDLPARLKEGRFREDLFYRFTHRIDVPPLRQRVEDLPLLIDHFAAEGAASRARARPSIPKTLVELLRPYPFPGNVRELRNMVDNAMSRSADDILPLEYFREYLRRSAAGRAEAQSAGVIGEAAAFTISGGLPTLKETEGLVIDEALRRVGGNQSLAARLLGLSPSALSRRLRKGPRS
jgi:two-component system, NtrC family, nitrogen regulation response regulator GlnG